VSEQASATASATAARGEIALLANAARHYADHGRLKDARDVYAGLIGLEPEVSYLHTGLGCVLMRLGCVGDALERFQEALRLDPRDVAALTFAGELLKAKGDESGIAYLDRAIALDPAGEDPWALRARRLRSGTVPAAEGGE
jgi:predicted Zn-dependent protease